MIVSNNLKHYQQQQLHIYIYIHTAALKLNLQCYLAALNPKPQCEGVLLLEYAEHVSFHI